MKQRGPGRPSTAQKAVEKLEEAGERRAADIVREVGGIPPRQLTADELFLREVVTLCTGGPPVGFNCDDEVDAIRKATLIAGVFSPRGGEYRVVRKGARLEVSG